MKISLLVFVMSVLSLIAQAEPLLLPGGSTSSSALMPGPGQTAAPILPPGRSSGVPALGTASGIKVPEGFRVIGDSTSFKVILEPAPVLEFQQSKKALQQLAQATEDESLMDFETMNNMARSLKRHDQIARGLLQRLTQVAQNKSLEPSQRALLKAAVRALSISWANSTKEGIPPFLTNTTMNSLEKDLRTSTAPNIKPIEGKARLLNNASDLEEQAIKATLSTKPQELGSIRQPPSLSDSLELAISLTYGKARQAAICLKCRCRN